MTEKELFREIGRIDEKYIIEAEAVKKSVLSRPVWIRSLSAAACFCLCAGLYFGMVRSGNFGADQAAREDMTSGEECTQMRATENAPEEVRTAESSAKTEYEQGKEQLSVPVTESLQDEALPDLKTIKKRFADYPEEAQKLAEQGLVVNLHGKLEDGQERLDAFLHSAQEGKMAALDLVQFTAEGNPIFYYLQYDGTDFYAVTDYRRDAFAGSGKRVYEYHYPFLKVFEKEIEGGTRIFLFLTEEENLTLEAYENREGNGFSLMDYTKTN